MHIKPGSMSEKYLKIGAVLGLNICSLHGEFDRSPSRRAMLPAASFFFFFLLT